MTRLNLWYNRPQDIRAAARAKAAAALHAKHPIGLTVLEASYLRAMRDGRIPCEE
jgi:hypothetical protein